MYEPLHFRAEDREAAFRLVRENPLGLLISQGVGEIIANPIPFLLEEESDKLFLRAHVARPNPQWKLLQESPQALVVFQGLGHYVTPEWYETKRESGKVVPTWNYMLVQMRGAASIREDRDFLHRQISALTSTHEGKRADPWAVTDAPDAYIEAQMRGILGIEIEVARWSGKFKLSQNRSEADRAGVVTGLAAEPGAVGPAMSAIMASTVEKKQS
ncbi:MAG: FMN-binding negative transcriptional regulator [Proteobacteria bacterium]|nr:FMN-binding negative transcriptional regulator [Pseudomonadota bacterium]